jgi:hypothetical protein
MDAVVFASRSDVRLVLTPARRSHEVGREELPTWHAQLSGRGLDASVVWANHVNGHGGTLRVGSRAAVRGGDVLSPSTTITFADGVVGGLGAAACGVLLVDGSGTPA